MTTKQMIKELYIVAGKHKNDVVGVGELNIHAMCIDVAQRLKELSEQTNTKKWIPCSERLPNPKGNEEFVRVEVTIQGKEKNVNMPAFYYYRIHKFFPWNIGGSPLKNVIAWMPLPEPYKAGDT